MVAHGAFVLSLFLLPWPLTSALTEILTQILSHLHPDSHAAVALVSKRFYALVTTPYAWRAAFLRYFPGQDALADHVKYRVGSKPTDSSDCIRSEVRYFTRLTLLSSWRSEYLLRTRLLRSVVRGKPGVAGAAVRSSCQSGKKATAVLTYNPKLPWLVTSLHADFTGGRKGPRAIHGSADLGMATFSDPTTGRIEKLGLDDPFSFQQLDEVFPDLEYWGLGDGPAAVPNVIDVSQHYGLAGGEGFPGGHVYYKAPGQLRGRYLGRERSALDPLPPDIPKIPELSEAISCVWIAKSSNVPTITQSMVGIMVGSTLGVVTSYALGRESTGPRYADGDITARWVLSPGVPIVDIKVDDHYCYRRKALGRVWAVALNALGEVFYLTEVPEPVPAREKVENGINAAWRAGRTAYWELIESTRRRPRLDEFNKTSVSDTSFPRSPANSMGLSKEQIAADARQIEQLMRQPPTYFRRAFEGWDMLRRLEVDFAAGSEGGDGEAIFVITCGDQHGGRPSIRRYVRGNVLTELSRPSRAGTPPQSYSHRGSLLGGNVTETGQKATPEDFRVALSTLGLGRSNSGSSPARAANSHEWQVAELAFTQRHGLEITASAVDQSMYAVVAAFEDPLLSSSQTVTPNPAATPIAKQPLGEIPGRRARLLAVGTNAGSIFVWNTRDGAESVIHPLRIIQTESPEVTSLALSSLYLVHGGSDSLVQVWDPLASSPDPIRTINAKSNGRIPRHLLNANPALAQANYFSVRAIFLDPDPTALRGILACGTYVRFWNYSSSSTTQHSGRKRRHRHHHDIVHGAGGARRNSNTVESHIAAEQAELRRERERREKELERLRRKYVGDGWMGELTEEEALQYARIISEEAYLLEEQRRLSVASTSDKASTAEAVSGRDTTSSVGSVETITPEPSLSGAAAAPTVLEPSATPSSSNLEGRQLRNEHDDQYDSDYEAQLQHAIRLSLMEAGCDADTVVSVDENVSQSSLATHYGHEFKVKKTKTKSTSRKEKGKAPLLAPGAKTMESGSYHYSGGSGVRFDEGPNIMPDEVGFRADFDTGIDDDLALALRLSLEEEERRLRRANNGVVGVFSNVDEYVPLSERDERGKGKEKSM